MVALAARPVWGRRRRGGSGKLVAPPFCTSFRLAECPRASLSLVWRETPSSTLSEKRGASWRKGVKSTPFQVSSVGLLHTWVGWEGVCTGSLHPLGQARSESAASWAMGVRLVQCLATCNRETHRGWVRSRGALGGDGAGGGGHGVGPHEGGARPVPSLMWRVCPRRALLGCTAFCFGCAVKDQGGHLCPILSSDGQP